MENEIDLLNQVNNEDGTDMDKALSVFDQGDKEVPVFLLEWLSNGFNATVAYKKLHPNISDASARVLGSRKLAKVNISAILAAYGIEYSDFFKQMKDGLGATKWNEFTGERVPDHRTRLEYLKVMGKMLDLIKT